MRDTCIIIFFGVLSNCEKGKEPYNTANLNVSPDPPFGGIAHALRASRSTEIIHNQLPEASLKVGGHAEIIHVFYFWFSLKL